MHNEKRREKMQVKLAALTGALFWYFYAASKARGISSDEAVLKRVNKVCIVLQNF